MAHKTEWLLTEGIQFLARLPEGTYFGTVRPQGLEFPATTLEKVQKITRCFPGLFWKKEWNKSLTWWEYTALTPDGVKLRIYAVQQNPPTCKAVTEIRQVKKQVPVQFETRLVEKEVIVGWDCEDEAG